MKVFVIWMLLAINAFGQLAWEAKQLDFKPMAGDRSLSATFRFENKGRRPVKIQDLQTSCGCTTASTARKSYAPGEKGEVAVKFLFGGRRGLQNKSVVVQTDDPSEPAVVLMLKVDILELVKIRPGYLHWKRDSAKSSQTLDIKVTSAVPAKVVSVSSSDPRFSAQLRPGDAGEYEVIVVPRDTSVPAVATLLIQTDYPPARPEIYKAFAQIK
jgi:hypothetical protein